MSALYSIHTPVDSLPRTLLWELLSIARGNYDACERAHVASW